MMPDNAIHEALDALNDVRWRETAFADLQWYYAEGGVYVFRCKHEEPNEHLCVIRAKSADEAIARAVFDLYKADEKKKSAPVGDIVAMRKTLEEMATDFEDLASRDGIRAPAYSSIFSIYAEKCRKALAAPSRNCEVGGAVEQNKRFVEYCKNHRIKLTGHSDVCNPKCPCRKGGDLNLCALAWAQMPYGAKESEVN